MESQQLWVEPVGGIIIARIRGVPSPELLKECQERVLLLIRDTQRGKSKRTAFPSGGSGAFGLMIAAWFRRKKLFPNVEFAGGDRFQRSVRLCS